MQWSFFISDHLSHPTPEKVQQNISACLHFTFSALHTSKNLPGDGRPSQSQETCLPNGVTQAGSWSNWLPAQLLFHQAAAQTLPPTCTAVYSKRARTVVSTVQQSQEHTQAPSCEHATCCLRSSFHICKSSPKYTKSASWFRHHTSSTMYMYSSRLFSWSPSSCHSFPSSTSSRLPPAAKRYIATSPHPEAALGHCLRRETSRNSYSAITCGVARGYLLVLLGSSGY